MRGILVASIVASVSLAAGVASADSKASTTPTTPTLAEPARSEERMRIVDHGPNRLLLATGIATVGFAYGVSGWVGLTTERPSERWLVVPLAGPMMALGTREACGEGVAASCEVEPTYKALLVADAVLQLGGAAQIAAAFAVRELRESDRPLLRQTFSVVPSRVPGGAALFAQGTF